MLRSLSMPESEQFEPDLFAAVVRHVCLREQPREGAILVFLSGWDEIGKVHKALKEDPVIGDGEWDDGEVAGDEGWCLIQQ